MKGCYLFRKWGKLGPKHISPFRVISQVGKVAYKSDLPVELSQIHSTFHVSQIWNFLADYSTVVPFHDIQVDEHLNIKRQVAILYIKTNALHNKVVVLVKI